MICLIKQCSLNFVKSATAIFPTLVLPLLCAAFVSGCSSLNGKIDLDSLKQAYEDIRKEIDKPEDPTTPDNPEYSAPSGALVGVLWRNRAAVRYMNSLNYSDDRWNKMLTDLRNEQCNYIALISANQKDGESAGYSPYANGLLSGDLNQPWLDRAIARVNQLKAMGFTVEIFLITDDSPQLARDPNIIAYARNVEDWFDPDIICPSIEMDEIWRDWSAKGSAIADAVDKPVAGHFLKGNVRSFRGMEILNYQATSQDTRRLANEVKKVIDKVDVPVMLFEVSGRGLNGWPEGGKAAVAVGAAGSGVGMTRDIAPSTDNPYEGFRWDTNQAGNPKDAKVVGRVWDVRLNGRRSVNWMDDRPKSWPNIGDKGTDAILYMINYSKSKIQKIEWIYEGQQDRSLRNVGDYKHATPAPESGDEVSFLLVDIKADQMVIPDWNEREVWP